MRSSAARTRQTPRERQRAQLREWSETRLKEYGTDDGQYNLALDGLDFGDAYALVTDEDDQLDASKIATSMMKLTLDTLKGEDEDRVEALDQWFGWLQPLVVKREHEKLMPATMTTKVKVIDLLSRLDGIIKEPYHGINLDAGKDFDGLDVRVVDQRTNGSLSAEHGAEIKRVLGANLGAEVADSDNQVLAVVHEARSKYSFKGENGALDEQVGVMIMGEPTIDSENWEDAEDT